MATVLDVGLVGYFQPIYAVLLVFAIVFSLLQKLKTISDSKTINSTIAVMVSLLVLLSDKLIKVINFMIPWFAILIIFLVLLLLIFKLMGATDEKISQLFTKDNTITWAVLGISLVIIIAAFANVFGQEFLEKKLGGQAPPTAEGETTTGSEDFQQNIFLILFHPKVLGMLILFIVAIFAILLLSSS